MTGKPDYFKMAREGTLPADFAQWELTDKRGHTVAHHAAMRGSLPAGFSRWALADNKGWTVAHEAAAYGHLPDDFDRWELTDEDGLTVRQVFLVRDFMEAKGLLANLDHDDDE